ncbi:putative ARM repeat-containing protein [Monocercomonoides exilis]|uniref:putative ARM repeat-containing protein n=1 Tax=Monocercomonoides exilis TaxID=2049356 RepID=UPI00355A3A0C|nr:putative ARM repeat-containing protein [Monocercomonoides exilis]|eukprot:MONOS_5952.1-p1 / transcript=MONOS_5952.1 / gene=MONOS_5952 / organism=Monocercomonoides_exilis_PA203 / gene_product=ARM repeat-containing protein / transcript_product=ARM repeat-containing protein / location=Mono_scaffold00180:23096-41537(+) / protein_length=5743 / sequence_SO=supercontig / SO=protein_coding / is_pseudo=false
MKQLPSSLFVCNQIIRSAVELFEDAFEDYAEKSICTSKQQPNTPVLTLTPSSSRQSFKASIEEERLQNLRMPAFPFSYSQLHAIFSSIVSVVPFFPSLSNSLAAGGSTSSQTSPTLASISSLQLSSPLTVLMTSSSSASSSSSSSSSSTDSANNNPFDSSEESKDSSLFQTPFPTHLSFVAASTIGNITSSFLILDSFESVQTEANNPNILSLIDSTPRMISCLGEMANADKISQEHQSGSILPLRHIHEMTRRILFQIRNSSASSERATLHASLECIGRVLFAYPLESSPFYSFPFESQNKSYYKKSWKYNASSFEQLSQLNFAPFSLSHHLETFLLSYFFFAPASLPHLLYLNEPSRVSSSFASCLSSCAPSKPQNTVSLREEIPSHLLSVRSLFFFPLHCSLYLCIDMLTSSTLPLIAASIHLPNTADFHFALSAVGIWHSLLLSLLSRADTGEVNMLMNRWKEKPNQSIATSMSAMQLKDATKDEESIRSVDSSNDLSGEKDSIKRTNSNATLSQDKQENREDSYYPDTFYCFPPFIITFDSELQSLMKSLQNVQSMASSSLPSSSSLYSSSKLMAASQKKPPNLKITQNIQSPQKTRGKKGNKIRTPPTTPTASELSSPQSMKSFPSFSSSSSSSASSSIGSTSPSLSSSYPPPFSSLSSASSQISTSFLNSCLSSTTIIPLATHSLQLMMNVILFYDTLLKGGSTDDVRKHIFLSLLLSFSGLVSINYEIDGKDSDKQRITSTAKGLRCTGYEKSAPQFQAERLSVSSSESSLSLSSSTLSPSLPSIPQASQEKVQIPPQNQQSPFILLFQRSSLCRLLLNYCSREGVRSNVRMEQTLSAIVLIIAFGWKREEALFAEDYSTCLAFENDSVEHESDEDSDEDDLSDFNECSASTEIPLSKSNISFSSKHEGSFIEGRESANMGKLSSSVYSAADIDLSSQHSTPRTMQVGFSDERQNDLFGEPLCPVSPSSIPIASSTSISPSSFSSLCASIPFESSISALSSTTKVYPQKFHFHSSKTLIVPFNTSRLCAQISAIQSDISELHVFISLLPFILKSNHTINSLQSIYSQSFIDSFIQVTWIAVFLISPVFRPLFLSLSLEIFHRPALLFSGCCISQAVKASLNSSCNAAQLCTFASQPLNANASSLTVPSSSASAGTVGASSFSSLSSTTQYPFPSSSASSSPTSISSSLLSTQLLSSIPFIPPLMTTILFLFIHPNFRIRNTMGYIWNYVLSLVQIARDIQTAIQIRQREKLMKEKVAMKEAKRQMKYQSMLVPIASPHEMQEDEGGTEERTEKNLSDNAISNSKSGDFNLLSEQADILSASETINSTEFQMPKPKKAKSAANEKNQKGNSAQGGAQSTRMGGSSIQSIKNTSMFTATTSKSAAAVSSTTSPINSLYLLISTLLMSPSSSTCSSLMSSLLSSPLNFSLTPPSLSLQQQVTLLRDLYISTLFNCFILQLPSYLEYNASRFISSSTSYPSTNSANSSISDLISVDDKLMESSSEKTLNYHNLLLLPIHCPISFNLLFFALSAALAGTSKDVSSLYASLEKQKANNEPSSKQRQQTKQGNKGTQTFKQNDQSKTNTSQLPQKAVSESQQVFATESKKKRSSNLSMQQNQAQIQPQSQSNNPFHPLHLETPNTSHPSCGVCGNMESHFGILTPCQCAKLAQIAHSPIFAAASSSSSLSSSSSTPHNRLNSYPFADCSNAFTWTQLLLHSPSLCFCLQQLFTQIAAHLTGDDEGANTERGFLLRSLAINEMNQVKNTEASQQEKTAKNEKSEKTPLTLAANNSFTIPTLFSPSSLPTYSHPLAVDILKQSSLSALSSISPVIPPSQSSVLARSLLNDLTNTISLLKTSTALSSNHPSSFEMNCSSLSSFYQSIDLWKNNVVFIFSKHEMAILFSQNEEEFIPRTDDERSILQMAQGTSHVRASKPESSAKPATPQEKSQKQKEEKEKEDSDKQQIEAKEKIHNLLIQQNESKKKLKTVLNFVNNTVKIFSVFAASCPSSVRPLLPSLVPLLTSSISFPFFKDSIQSMLSILCSHIQPPSLCISLNRLLPLSLARFFAQRTLNPSFFGSQEVFSAPSNLSSLSKPLKQDSTSSSSKTPTSQSTLPMSSQPLHTLIKATFQILSPSQENTSSLSSSSFSSPSLLSASSFLLLLPLLERLLLTKNLPSPFSSLQLQAFKILSSHCVLPHSPLFPRASIHHILLSLLLSQTSFTNSSRLLRLPSLTVMSVVDTINTLSQTTQSVLDIAPMLPFLLHSSSALRMIILNSLIISLPVLMQSSEWKEEEASFWATMHQIPMMTLSPLLSHSQGGKYFSGRRKRVLLMQLIAFIWLSRWDEDEECQRIADELLEKVFIECCLKKKDADGKSTKKGNTTIMSLQSSSSSIASEYQIKHTSLPFFNGYTLFPLFTALSRPEESIRRSAVSAILGCIVTIQSESIDSNRKGKGKGKKEKSLEKEANQNKTNTSPQNADSQDRKIKGTSSILPQSSSSSALNIPSHFLSDYEIINENSKETNESESNEENEPTSWLETALNRAGQCVSPLFVLECMEKLYVCHCECDEEESSQRKSSIKSEFDSPISSPTPFQSSLSAPLLLSASSTLDELYDPLFDSLSLPLSALSLGHLHPSSRSTRNLKDNQAFLSILNLFPVPIPFSRLSSPYSAMTSAASSSYDSSSSSVTSNLAYPFLASSFASLLCGVAHTFFYLSSYLPVSFSLPPFQSKKQQSRSTQSASSATTSSSSSPSLLPYQPAIRVTQFMVEHGLSNDLERVSQTMLSAASKIIVYSIQKEKNERLLHTDSAVKIKGLPQTSSNKNTSSGVVFLPFLVFPSALYQIIEQNFTSKRSNLHPTARSDRNMGCLLLLAASFASSLPSSSPQLLSLLSHIFFSFTEASITLQKKASIALSVVLSSHPSLFRAFAAQYSDSLLKQILYPSPSSFITVMCSGINTCAQNLGFTASSASPLTSFSPSLLSSSQQNSLTPPSLPVVRKGAAYAIAGLAGAEWTASERIRDELAAQQEREFYAKEKKDSEKTNSKDKGGKAGEAEKEKEKAKDKENEKVTNSSKQQSKKIEISLEDLRVKDAPKSNTEKHERIDWKERNRLKKEKKRNAQMAATSGMPMASISSSSSSALSPRNSTSNSRSSDSAQSANIPDEHIIEGGLKWLVNQSSIFNSIKTAATSDKSSLSAKEGALVAFEVFFHRLSKGMEPLFGQILPILLSAFSETNIAVRQAAKDASKALIRHLSSFGISYLLPSLLYSLNPNQKYTPGSIQHSFSRISDATSPTSQSILLSPSLSPVLSSHSSPNASSAPVSIPWRTKQGAVEILGRMAHLSASQMSLAMPIVVPALTTVLTDPHPLVQSAAKAALKTIAGVVRNKTVQKKMNEVIDALCDVSKTDKVLVFLLDCAAVAEDEDEGNFWVDERESACAKKKKKRKKNASQTTTGKAGQSGNDTKSIISRSSLYSSMSAATVKSNSNSVATSKSQLSAAPSEVSSINTNTSFASSYNTQLDYEDEFAQSRTKMKLDAASLALLAPIVIRGLRSRTPTTKIYSLRAVSVIPILLPLSSSGKQQLDPTSSSSTLTDSSIDKLGPLRSLLPPSHVAPFRNQITILTPYLPQILPQLRCSIVDASHIRTVTAECLESLTRWLGEDSLQGMREWMVAVLESGGEFSPNADISRSASGSFDRSGSSIISGSVSSSGMEKEEGRSIDEKKIEEERGTNISGAALGLASILSVGGIRRVMDLINVTAVGMLSSSFHVRSGFLAFFKALPGLLGASSEALFPMLLPFLIHCAGDSVDKCREEAHQTLDAFIRNYCNVKHTSEQKFLTTATLSFSQLTTAVVQHANELTLAPLLQWALSGSKPLTLIPPLIGDVVSQNATLKTAASTSSSVGSAPLLSSQQQKQLLASIALQPLPSFHIVLGCVLSCLSNDPNWRVRLAAATIMEKVIVEGVGVEERKRLVKGRRQRRMEKMKKKEEENAENKSKQRKAKNRKEIEKEEKAKLKEEKEKKEQEKAERERERAKVRREREKEKEREKQKRDYRNRTSGSGKKKGNKDRRSGTRGNNDDSSEDSSYAIVYDSSDQDDADKEDESDNTEKSELSEESSVESEIEEDIDNERNNNTDFQAHEELAADYDDMRSDYMEDEFDTSDFEFVDPGNEFEDESNSGYPYSTLHLDDEMSEDELTKQNPSLSASNPDQSITQRQYQVHFEQSLSSLLTETQRNELYVSLFLARFDTSREVQQKAVSVWKELVDDPSKILPSLLPLLIRTISSVLSSATAGSSKITGALSSKQLSARQFSFSGTGTLIFSAEQPNLSYVPSEATYWQKEVASSCLQDLATKHGDQVFTTILPLLTSDITSGTFHERVGSILALASLVTSAEPSLIQVHLASLLTCIRIGIDDEAIEVRRSAFIVLNMLHNYTDKTTWEKIVRKLLSWITNIDTKDAQKIALEDDSDKDKGMQQSLLSGGATVRGRKTPTRDSLLKTTHAIQALRFVCHLASKVPTFGKIISPLVQPPFTLSNIRCLSALIKSSLPLITVPFPSLVENLVDVLAYISGLSGGNEEISARTISSSASSSSLASSNAPSPSGFATPSKSIVKVAGNSTNPFLWAVPVSEIVHQIFLSDEEETVDTLCSLLVNSSTLKQMWSAWLLSQLLGVCEKQRRLRERKMKEKANKIIKRRKKKEEEECNDKDKSRSSVEVDVQSESSDSNSETEISLNEDSIDDYWYPDEEEDSEEEDDENHLYILYDCRFKALNHLLQVCANVESWAALSSSNQAFHTQETSKREDIQTTSESASSASGSQPLSNAELCEILRAANYEEYNESKHTTICLNLDEAITPRSAVCSAFASILMSLNAYDAALFGEQVRSLLSKIDVEVENEMEKQKDIWRSLGEREKYMASRTNGSFENSFDSHNKFRLSLKEHPLFYCEEGIVSLASILLACITHGEKSDILLGCNGLTILLKLLSVLPQNFDSVSKIFTDEHFKAMTASGNILNSPFVHTLFPLNAYEMFHARKSEALSLLSEIKDKHPYSIRHVWQDLNQYISLTTLGCIASALIRTASEYTPMTLSASACGALLDSLFTLFSVFGAPLTLFASFAVESLPSFFSSDNREIRERAASVMEECIPFLKNPCSLAKRMFDLILIGIKHTNVKVTSVPFDSDLLESFMQSTLSNMQKKHLQPSLSLPAYLTMPSPLHNLPLPFISLPSSVISTPFQCETIAVDAALRIIWRIICVSGGHICDINEQMETLLMKDLVSVCYDSNGTDTMAQGCQSTTDAVKMTAADAIAAFARLRRGNVLENLLNTILSRSNFSAASPQGNGKRQYYTLSPSLLSTMHNQPSVPNSKTEKSAFRFTYSFDPSVSTTDVSFLNATFTFHHHPSHRNIRHFHSLLLAALLNPSYLITPSAPLPPTTPAVSQAGISTQSSSQPSSQISGSNTHSTTNSLPISVNEDDLSYMSASPMNMFAYSLSSIMDPSIAQSRQPPSVYSIPTAAMKMKSAFSQADPKIAPESLHFSDNLIEAESSSHLTLSSQCNLPQNASSFGLSLPRCSFDDSFLADSPSLVAELAAFLTHAAGDQRDDIRFGICLAVSRFILNPIFVNLTSQSLSDSLSLQPAVIKILSPTHSLALPLSLLLLLSTLTQFLSDTSPNIVFCATNAIRRIAVAFQHFPIEYIIQFIAPLIENTSSSHANVAKASEAALISLFHKGDAGRFPQIIETLKIHPSTVTHTSLFYLYTHKGALGG